MAQKSLLKLIKIIIPLKNKLPNTINKIYKQVSPAEKIYKQDFYCNVCLSLLNREKFCEKCQFSCVKRSSSFSYINIRTDIQKLIFDYHWIIDNYVASNRNYLDILDGQYYKITDAFLSF